VQRFKYFHNRTIRGLTFASSFLLSIFFLRCRNLDNVREIMIIQLAELGDVIISLPTISGLRRAFPSAHIIAVVGQWAKEFVEHFPDVDEVIGVQFRGAATVRRNKEKGEPFFRIVKSLALRRPDIIVDLKGDFISQVIWLLSKAHFRVDRGIVRIRELLLSVKHSNVVPFHRHETELCRAIVSPLGVKLYDYRPTLLLKEKDVHDVDVLLEQAGLASEEKFVVIHPGAGWIYRRWFPERYAELSDRIANSGVKTLFTGSRGEEEIVKQILLHQRTETINLVGKTSLMQLALILEKAILFIGSDSGPMHLASAMGTPIVALFGPNSPLKFRPAWGNNEIIWKGLACSPCSQYYCVHRTNICMEQISVEDVWERVRKLLSSHLYTPDNERQVITHIAK
jgi:predicted lipopolysaccharide heptosyltransferase III